jgi:hypothetical protein
MVYWRGAAKPTAPRAAGNAQPPFVLKSHRRYLQIAIFAAFALHRILLRAPAAPGYQERPPGFA